MKSNGKIIGKWKTFLMMLVFGFGALFHMELEVRAAELVDTTVVSSLTFQIPKAFQLELMDETISVRLYRIAEMNEDGTLKDITGYEELKLSEISFDVTAQQMEQKADEAAAFLQADIWSESPAYTPYKEFEIVNNQAVITDMETGLYLVCVKPFQKENDEYEALPYLLSLPTLVITEGLSGERMQEWNYDLMVDLKLGCKEPQDQTPGDIPIGPSENISDDPPKDVTEEAPEGEMQPLSSTDIAVKYKTGDEMNVMLLLGSTILFGSVFIIVCLLEKKSKSRGDNQDGLV